MCLLMYKKAGVTFTDAQLTDMYHRNQDGYGIMYAQDGVLYTNKGIGTVMQWIDFFRKHEHLEACIHLRMRTHGDIDLDNCHPYDVLGFDTPHVRPMAIMHNGILSHGNSKDKSKSDTWHYIRNTLRPLLDQNPDLAFTPVFHELISHHIGMTNKFALMDNAGRIQIVNKHAGLTWEGTWFSNRYAWSAYDNSLYPGICPPAPKQTQEAFNFPVSSRPVKYKKGKNGSQQTEPSTYKGLSAWDNFEEFYGSNTDKPVPKVVPMLPNSTPITKLVTDMKSKLRTKSFFADVDYIRSVLADDVPAAAKQISVSMVETLIESIGTNAVEDIIYDAIMTDKPTKWLVDMFRSQQDAREYTLKRDNKELRVL